MIFLGVCFSLFFTFFRDFFIPLFFPLFFSLFFYYFCTFDGVFLIDYYRFLMVFISLWVVIFSKFSIGFSNFSTVCFLRMFILLFYCFIISRYLFFYIFFEVVFVFMFIFLLSQGKTMERLQASFYIFFFTMIFSLPFLVFMVYCLIDGVGFDFYSFFSFNCYFRRLFWGFIFLVFSVKLPLYGVHMWLPKAHVEAPVSGSMILAGVLLKLGGYGIIRFMPLVSFLNFFNSYFLSLLFYFSLYGGVILSFLCMRQNDLKIIIAYSSVVHMSVMMCGILRYSE